MLLTKPGRYLATNLSPASVTCHLITGFITGSVRQQVLPSTSGRGNEWQGLRVAGVTSGRGYEWQG